MLLNCYWLSRVGGQTDEQTFTPLPSTEHFQRLCVPSPLRPPAPVSTSPSDPKPQGPAFSFRRSSVTRSSLCEEESSFSSAGSTAGLYLHKPWVSSSRQINSLGLSTGGKRSVNWGVNKLAANLSSCSWTEPNFLHYPTMRSGLGLCVLGLLCLSSSVRAQVRRWDNILWSDYHKIPLKYWKLRAAEYGWLI